MGVGYLPSSFDLINVRDLELIAQAREHCSWLVVGVLTDEDVESLYGRRPVVPLVERMALVRHVRGVSEVVVHDEVRLADQASDTVVFTVVHEPALTKVSGAVFLTPARETKSAILRHALRVTERTSVA